ncbi:hypothetical protein HLB44_25450 [Aquincola sp. S2]|uniref:Uncharacterized protein n=1 Tax=Pseudaquabacterium terrae TaxID=2732868 RepID=A0ABX2EP92_9BURK|nr:hypothetical protein [Aquabacterium terrae]NRF70360.1 hypothetical protein [Aquabacterium terrae]
MNERLAQLQIRLALLNAQTAGLSQARAAAAEYHSRFRAAISRHGAMVSAADLPALAALPASELQAQGVDPGDLNRAIKDVRFCEAIEREHRRLIVEVEPLRTLIERIEKERSTDDQWKAAS